MKKIGFVLTILSCFPCIAQVDPNGQRSTAQERDTIKVVDVGFGTMTLSEYTVTGFRADRVTATSLNIKPYQLKELSEKSPLNLSDALAKIPGIGQMTTGNAISKPVIRGMFGNRILVLLSGLRFDNQQFQDEHGLGLSQIGIDRVEVIKGPASLLYGTDAVGGVINIIEQEIPWLDGKHLDINTRLYSNTLGTLTDIGYSKRNHENWWRIRGGYENHSDYTDGNNTRVLNSRNKGYYLKSGLGFTHKNWTQNNSYNFSFNQYGFILDKLNLFFDADSRWSRAMEGPHHNVLLNVLSSQNTINLRSSVLKLNSGVQSNRRMEDEGGGAISLDMHLLSFLENAKWEKHFGKRTLFVINQQFTYENNDNLGKRILIPDATFLEGNLSSFARFYLGKLNMETGVGIGYKHISTKQTGLLNQPGEIIQPFSIGHPSVNGMLGISYNPNRWLNIKANAASGFRSGNLAELSSNGLHEGTYRYELGDPNLHIEQNINADFSIEATRDKWFLSVSAFYNRFFNYIYLAPTNDSIYGFQIYKYQQQNAKLYGGELIAIYKPIKYLQVKESFSSATGLLDDGKYLPFIPAWKSVSSIRFEKDLSAKLKSFYAEPELEYIFAQNNAARFETTTTDYVLINVHAGFRAKISGRTFNWGLSCRNLLNKTYTDHLSRLKYYGLYNQGVNFIVSLNTNLDWK